MTTIAALTSTILLVAVFYKALCCEKRYINVSKTIQCTTLQCNAIAEGVTVVSK